MGLGMAQASATMAQGRAQSTEALYNAKVKEQQAGVITEAQRIEASQYDRQMGRVAGTTRANVGRAGFTMSGSPMAVLLDTQTQMEMDKAIGQYNLETQKQFAYSEAANYRDRARTSRDIAYKSAFSQVLMTGTDYAMKAGWLKIR